LASACAAVGISRDRMHQIASPEEREIISNTSEMALLKYRIRNNHDIAVLARTVLLERLRESSEARRSFAVSVFNYPEFVKRFRKKLQEADVDLRAEKPELFPEWDRLMAEGEFRRGVSIPLIGVLLSLGILIIRIVDKTPPNIAVAIVCCAPFVVGGVLHRAGTHRVKDANRVLYSCIRQGRIMMTRDKIFGEELFVPQNVEPVGYLSPLAQSRSEWIEAATARVISANAARMRRSAKVIIDRARRSSGVLSEHCATCSCPRGGETNSPESMDL